jgi:hypothetical protein
MTHAPHAFAAIGLLACLCAFPGPAWAGEGGDAASGLITADRPDASESSEVVGTGRFQIETSLLSQREPVPGGGVQHRLDLPTLLRLGIAAQWELRLESDALTRLRRADGSLASGMADLSPGVKWHMQDADEDEGLPSVAWLLHADLSSGADALREPGTRPSLRMVAEWDLPHGWSLGLMPGLASQPDEQGQRYASGLLAVTLGKAWTPAWRGFVEWYAARLAAERHGGNAASVNAGFAWLPGQDVQLDLSWSKGLTGDAPLWNWGVGLSLRY